MPVQATGANGIVGIVSRGVSGCSPIRHLPSGLASLNLSTVFDVDLLIIMRSEFASAVRFVRSVRRVAHPPGAVQTPQVTETRPLIRHFTVLPTRITASFPLRGGADRVTAR